MKKIIFFRQYQGAELIDQILPDLRKHMEGRIRILSSTIPVEVEAARVFANIFGVEFEAHELLTEDLRSIPRELSARPHIVGECEKIVKLLETIVDAEVVLVVMEADYILEVSVQMLDAYERRRHGPCIHLPFKMQHCAPFEMGNAMIMTFNGAKSFSIEILS